jgi:hypothetical protein
MPFKSYTSCVQPQDYRNPPVGEVEAVLADIGLLLLAPVVFGPATWFALREVLEYMLNGKLVCLGGDRCAIGQVISFETPGDKSFPESIDNDFSINLLLSPNTLEDFINLNFDDANKEAQTGFQGNLITEQAGMPVPYEAEDDMSGHPLRFAGYPYPRDPVRAYEIGDYTVPFPGTVNVPFLHLECEGSRVHDVLQTLKDINGFGTGICDVEIFGFPIGRVACSILDTIFAPIVLGLLVAAWYKAKDGNADDTREGGLSGQLEPGNIIVVTGRWVYDGSHQGWNELHPVKSIQKIAERIETWEGRADPQAQYDLWCTQMMQVPPPNRDGPGGAPSTMSSDQQVIWDSQIQPENRWILHPLIDGCLPPDQPPPTNIK